MSDGTASTKPSSGLRPWKPGQSGNPAGRGKADFHLRDLARSHAPEALATLVALMAKGKTEKIRLDAANALLDRGFGKPTQPIAGDDAMPPVQVELAGLSDAELQTRIAEMAARMGIGAGANS